MSDSRRHHRRRRSHQSKSVSTSEELAVTWALKAGFVVIAILIAAGITFLMHRR